MKTIPTEHESTSPPGPHLSGAFLLAQLGAHAAARYRDRIAELDLTPAHCGLLAAIARGPGRSQQAIAAELGTPPTRLVALLDTLEKSRAIERRRNPDDRRNHALCLTDEGVALLRRVGAVSASHDHDITAALDDAERDQLRALLARIADQQGLTPGVHPGYRTLRGEDCTPE
ncbi:MAG: MarR family winged helix-turn-helix transcriptional regulator [Sciscionella sp.]